jgi:hypothetical protein
MPQSGTSYFPYFFNQSRFWIDPPIPSISSPILITLPLKVKVRFASSHTPLSSGKITNVEGEASLTFTTRQLLTIASGAFRGASIAPPFGFRDHRATRTALAVAGGGVLASAVGLLVMFVGGLLLCMLTDLLPRPVVP